MNNIVERHEQMVKFSIDYLYYETFIITGSDFYWEIASLLDKDETNYFYLSVVPIFLDMMLLLAD